MGVRWDVLSHEAAVGARQPGRANTWTNLGRQCSHCLTLSLFMQVILLFNG